MSKGFDIVIGNPPYVRADTKDKFHILQRNFLTKNPHYETLWEKWDLFVAFVEHSVKNILKDGGQFSFIVSDAICTVKYADRVRKWLQENFSIPEIDYFEDGEVFRGVGVNPIVFFVNKHKELIVTKKMIYSADLTEIKKEYSMNQTSEYLWKKDAPEILDFELGNCVLLCDICYISNGLTPSANEKVAKGEFTKDDLIADEYSEINNKPYIEGKHTSRYKIREIKYLEWGTERCPSRIRRLTFPELYEGKKIFSGCQTPGLIDNNNIISNHRSYIFRRFIDLSGVDNSSITNSLSRNNPNKTRMELEKSSNKYMYEYILVIINSKFGLEYMNAIRRDRTPYSFFPDDFRKLPIKTMDDQSSFVNLVNILQFLYQSDRLTDIVSFLDKELTNVLVYELYFHEKFHADVLYPEDKMYLLNAVKPYLKPINYEEWSKLDWKRQLGEITNSEQERLDALATENDTIINEVVKALQNDYEVQKWMVVIKSHEWVRKIEGE